MLINFDAVSVHKRDARWQPFGELPTDDVHVLSVALQCTSAVGANMSDLESDPDAVVPQGMLNIRLLDHQTMTVHALMFSEIYSFDFRDDGLETATLIADNDIHLTAQLRRSASLVRKLGAVENTWEDSATHWLIQSLDAVVEVLSCGDLPVYTTSAWTP